MEKTISIVIALFVAASLVRAQTASDVESDRALQRAVLLSEVKTLALEIPKLDSSLARAMAGAEIADAAWTLDRKWSKTLLREAYALTYLTEDEQRRIGSELRCRRRVTRKWTGNCCANARLKLSTAAYRMSR